MPVLKYPNPFLKKVCQPVTVFDSLLLPIFNQMDHEVVEAEGEAIAANQLGFDLRIFVVSPNYRETNVPRWICNPEIVNPVGTVRCIEGCLSIPGIKAWRNRYEAFTLKYQDEFGALKSFAVSGFFAIVCQHEIDHLNGKLFIEDISPIEKDRIADKLNKLRTRK